MHWQPQLAAILLLQGAVHAQVCPLVNIRLTNDISCGSTRYQGPIQNATCYQVDGGFSGVQVGHANDARYDAHCLIFALLDPCAGRKTQDNVTGAEIAAGFLPYTSAGDYGPCTNVVKSSTRVPSWLTMICGDQTVTGCPSSTGNPTTSTPTTVTMTTSKPTTSPSKTTTTSGPTTSGPTTSGPTTTAQANPVVTSAVNSASSKLASASAAVSSYYSNTTNAALASAAETALESAGVSSSDAKNVASDFSASSVAQKLDDLFEQVVKAAALVILAEFALDAASAASVMEAVRAAGPLLSAAAAAAADPGQNPKPSTTRASTSSTTSPDGPCTICVECAEAGLPKTTYTPASLPSGVSKRSEMASMEENLTNALRDVAYADEQLFKRIFEKRFEKRSSQRYGQYCNFQVLVPAYSSWSSTGSNPYKPYYDHYTTKGCGLWRWKLVSADTVATLPIAPVNYDYPDSGYETEHPYEIQQIADFLEYARQNIPIFKSKYTSGQQFCDGFFRNQLNSTTQFANSGVYDYSTKPINQIYNTLEGGTGGSTSEFVYLEEGVNGRKGSFFGRDNPSTATFNKYLDALASSTQAIIVAQYMQQPLIVSIYKKVSTRIRTQFVNFGRACNDSSAQQQWRDFGNIDWAGAYDSWESSYIDAVSGNIASFASGAASRAHTLIKLRLDQARLNQVALSASEKSSLVKLLAEIQAHQRDFASLSLSSLKR